MHNVTMQMSLKQACDVRYTLALQYDTTMQGIGIVDSSMHQPDSVPLIATCVVRVQKAYFSTGAAPGCLWILRTCILGKSPDVTTSCGICKFPTNG